MLLKGVIFSATFLLFFSVKAQVKPITSTSVASQTGTVAPNVPANYTTGILVNYIRSWTPQQSGYTLSTDVAAASSVTQVAHSTQYFDGLGRPLETVDWQASPNQKDLVTAQVYDAYGREQYKYLPYQSTDATGSFKLNPFTDQSTFYSTTYPNEQGALQNEKYYYSHTVFEASPLNRVAKTFAPGNTWAGSEITANGTVRSIAEKAVSVQYLVNNSTNEDVGSAGGIRIWDIGFQAFGDANNMPTSASGRVYAAGQLYKTVTFDEHGNAVVEYKDKEGHVVLKKVQIGTIASDYSGYTGFYCTFYVYDDLGQLRFVIPPKAVALMIAAGNWTLTTSVISELCFRYEYDQRQRMIAKKVPGADWMYMVYDNRDRLCYTQDGNMRTKSPQQWAYTLYDDINRPVETGIMTYTGTWANLQSAVASTANTTASNTTSGTYVNPVSSDLVVSNRDYTAPSYTATNSITFQDGFTTESSASFTAQIAASSASTFSTPETVNNAASLGSAATWYPLTYTYYDSYGFGSTKTFSTANNSSLVDGGNTSATLETATTAASGMTKGLVTGTRVRAIEDPTNLSLGAWLETVTYYDDKGRVAQVQSDNYKGGVDIASNRYNFTNKPISTYLAHNNPAAGKSGSNAVGVATTMLYDWAGRVMNVKKSVTYQSTTYARTLSQNTYDALGQLKNKAIGQKSSSDVSPIESDDYRYNIRGWLKGVNWYNAQAYASQLNTTNSSQPMKWFAFDLSYDWGMNSNVQQNGNISGQRWRSGGDGKERAYGYSYDATNRLIAADFTQNNGSWGLDAVLNFNVKMGDGVNAGTAYDENGNIKQMQQWGLAGTGSAQIDNLAYTYASSGVSNKLLAVKDNATQPTVQLGDFNDKNGSGNDYGYDMNGNLITDLNKRMNGSTDINQSSGGAIVYNHLNLPWQITVKNDDGSLKGTITYIYDALGNKLEKRTSEAASSYNNNQSKQTQTTYIAGFVYQNNVLQFLSHEEGRVRMVQPVISGTPTTNFVWDYFLKDHLGNVRMVLTDETKQDVYPAATLEASGLSTEQQYYDIQAGNVVPNPATLSGATNGTYYNNNGNPPYNTNLNVNTGAQSAQMYRLNGANGVKTGLGITLQVMAGDNVSIWGKSYYHTGGTTVNNSYPVSSALLALLSSFAGGSALSGKGVTGATLNTNTPTTTPLTNITNGITNPPAGVPKAGINWILFDAQFRPVANGYDAVYSSSDYVKSHNFTANITQNGYLYVYCSDESNIDVLFDNLQVIQNHGPLVEETHYYPFGLTMAGISSSAASSLENKYKFNKGSELQHKEWSDGSGLELYSTNFRSLDPQLGRWWQIDPKPNMALSPYSAMGDNPISFNDPLGDTLLTKADHRRADRIEKQINRTNASLNKQIAKWNGQIANAQAKGNTSQVNSLQSKVNDANAQITTNGNTLNNLNAISNDQTQAYTFNQLSSNSTEGGTVLKTMNVNGNNQSVVVMNVLSDANAVHESTHAYQGAIQHMFTFNLDNATYPVAFSGATTFAAQMVNANSEIGAYNAQYAFDPGTMPSSTMGGVPNSMNGINAFYVGGLNGTDAHGNSVPIYPNVQNMVNTIFSLLRVF